MVTVRAGSRIDADRGFARALNVPDSRIPYKQRSLAEPCQIVLRLFSRRMCR